MTPGALLAQVRRSDAAALAALERSDRSARVRAVLLGVGRRAAGRVRVGLRLARRIAAR